MTTDGKTGSSVTLLYDGVNKYEIRTASPIKIPVFWGYDVPLLRIKLLPLSTLKMGATSLCELPVFKTILQGIVGLSQIDVFSLKVCGKGCFLQVYFYGHIRCLRHV
jgi:hypothetical protein